MLQCGLLFRFSHTTAEAIKHVYLTTSLGRLLELAFGTTKTDQCVKMVHSALLLFNMLA